jgi:protocatechuate 3,4-dioxygenase beta subunit
VRWRLKEALGRLRVELDAAHRGDRRAWMIAFSPLAVPRRATTASLTAVVIAIATVCAVVAVIVVGFASRQAPSTTRGRAQRAVAVVKTAPSATSPSALTWLAQEGAPARPVTGRVLFAGAPVSGATVRLQSDPLPTREVRTDANGRFDLGEQMAHEYAIAAYLPGKLAAIRRLDLRDPAAPRDVELVLEDCAAGLYGRVLDASGAPLEGAHVLREGVIGSETDRSGNYDLCVLPTAALVAELRVVVRADGFGTLAMPIAAPGRLQRDFVLAPEATVVGRVVGPDGQPLANARVAVELTRSEESVPPERGFALTAISDADGSFRIAGLAAGEYTIGATSAHAVTPAVAVKVEATENASVELRAVATGTVRGRVVSHGTAIAGVTVAAGSAIAVSQADGTFVLGRVAIGDVELTTTPYKRSSGVVHVVEGDRNNVEVEVEPMAVLRGTVRRRGAAVPYARVDIVGPSRAGLTADAFGRYEARGLEAGKYAFYCDDRRRGAMFAEGAVVEVGAGESREHDIDLAWGSTIAGRVVDGRGEPVAGALVWFRAGMASHCLTDSSGAFTCGGMSSGAYAPEVFPGSGAAHAFRFVEPPAALELHDGDTRIDGVRLVIEPSLLAIEGRVVDGAGLPIADAVVRAVGRDRKSRGNFTPPPATISDEEGRFRIVALSAGEYFVEVERRGLATRETVGAGAKNVTLVLDRTPCDAAGAHELPATIVKPPAPVVWDRKIELVGWSVAEATKVNAPIEITLVYRALEPIDREWTIFAHFDSATTRVNADHNPGADWCPTARWRAGESIVDRFTVKFESVGRYALTVGFFTGRAPDWQNLALSSVPSAMDDTKQHGVHVADVTVKQ